MHPPTAQATSTHSALDLCADPRETQSPCRIHGQPPRHPGLWLTSVRRFFYLGEAQGPPATLGNTVGPGPHAEGVPGRPMLGARSHLCDSIKRLKRKVFQPPDAPYGCWRQRLHADTGEQPQRPSDPGGNGRPSIACPAPRGPKALGTMGCNPTLSTHSFPFNKFCAQPTCSHVTSRPPGRRPTSPSVRAPCRP